MNSVDKLTCHICYETPKEGKEVVCVNGHLCCQKHHLERIRAIYQEGRNAFGYGGEGEEVEDASGQQCFMCRVLLRMIVLENHISSVSGLSNSTNLARGLWEPTLNSIIRILKSMKR